MKRAMSEPGSVRWRAPQLTARWSPISSVDHLFRMKKTLLLAAVAMATPAFAQNDECTGALALAANAPTAFDTTAATPSATAWPCASGGGPDIWFSYTTSGVENIEVSTCDNATYDTAIEIFSGDCANLVPLTCNDDGAGCTGFTSIAAASNIAAGTDLFIRIGGFSGSVGTGTVTLTSTPGGGGGASDECAGAVPLVDGVSQSFDTTTATTSAPGWPCASGGSDIWFSYTTALASSDVTVETCGSSYDTAIEIFSGDCSSLTPLVCNDDACGLQSTAVATGLSSGTTLLIRVGGFGASSGLGTVLLTEGVGAPGCSALPDDSLEDNDDCAGAVALNDGSYPGLAVFDADNDYFAVTVADGGTLDASILFSNANGDVDLYLWDPLVACDTNVAGPGGGTGALALGFSASDDEFITYTNTTGASQNLILEVDMFDAGGCNNYDLNVTGGGVSVGPIGANYCSANANSTGGLSAMSAFGLTSVAANDVTLSASDLPPNQFGIFIVSATQGFVPNAGGTSNGNLCLGGAIGRYVGPGEILSSGAAGEFSLAIDLGLIPQGGGTTATMAGDTWNFQAWHRDAVGLGSNFTDGIEIVFTN